MTNPYIAPGIKKSARSIKDFAEAVAQVTGVSVSRIHSGSRKKEIAFAKHVTYYILRKRTQYTWKSMADFFSDHHSSAMHGSNKIEGYLYIKDPETCAVVEKIIDFLKQN